MAVKNPYTPAPYPMLDAADTDLPPEVKAQLDYARALGQQEQPMAEPEAPAPGVRVPFLNRTIPGRFIDAASPALLSALRSRGPAVRAGKNHDLANVASVIGQAYLGSRVSGAQDRARAHAEDLALAKEQRGYQQQDQRDALRAAGSALASWRHTKNGTSKQPPPPLTKEQAATIPGLQEGQVVDTQTYAEVLRRTRPVVKKEQTPLQAGFDPDLLADRVVQGLDSPMASEATRGMWPIIKTSIAKKYPKFNLARAQNTWVATNTFTKTLNGRQQTQIHLSADAVQTMLPKTMAMIDELDRLAPSTDATPINELMRGGTKNWGVNGRRAQELAQRITTDFASMTGELANVYNAGGVPSDKALDLAHQTLNLALPVHALKGGLDEESALINVRLNAIANARPAIPGAEGQQNPYIQPPVGDVPLANDPGAPANPHMQQAAKKFEAALFSALSGRKNKNSEAGVAAIMAEAKANGVPPDSIAAIQQRVINRLPGGKR